MSDVADRPAEWRAFVRAGERAFGDLADVVPGFAGYYFDGSDVVVRLTDTLSSALARDHVAEHVRTHFPIGPDVDQPRQVRVEPAEFGFLDLAWWHHLLLTETGAEEGLAWADISESQNRIVIAVLPEFLDAVAAQLAELADRFGIDTDAVVTIPGEQAVFDIGRPFMGTGATVSTSGKTLSYKQRPLQGGYRIHWSDGNGGSYPCTIGIVTIHDSKPSFVTNTHCSRKFGKHDDTPYYQPYYVDYEDRSVGTESHDPGWFLCNWIYKCRMTDANIVSFAGTYSDIDFGRIARTLHSNGSREIDPDNPYFTIVGGEEYVAEGYPVHKVGATTGWTDGKVTRTCLTSYIVLPHTGDTVRINCVDEADYVRESGDSGAPVFYRWGSDDVNFWGIHHAGHGDTGYGLFSRNARIQEELGGVRLYPYTPPPDDGEDCTDENGEPVPC